MPVNPQGKDIEQRTRQGELFSANDFSSSDKEVYTNRLYAADLEDMRIRIEANNKVIDEVLDRWKSVYLIPKVEEETICMICGAKIRKNENFCSQCGSDITLQRNSRITKNSANNESRKKGFLSKNGKWLITGLILLMGIIVGIYWWQNYGAKQVRSDRSAFKIGNFKSAVPENLKQASSYLPKPGITAEFYLSYPGKRSGTMQRITAQIVPDKSIISELELMDYKKKTYGYVYHYLQKDDGAYMVFDQSPQDQIPVLKNNMYPGLCWSYKDQDSNTTWKVLELGQKINLGFLTLDNCLLIEEKSDNVSYSKIICYAPGIGRVMETTMDKDKSLMIMTSLGKVDSAQAAIKVKKWAPNYNEI